MRHGLYLLRRSLPFVASVAVRPEIGATAGFVAGAGCDAVAGGVVGAPFVSP